MPVATLPKPCVFEAAHIEGTLVSDKPLRLIAYKDGQFKIEKDAATFLGTLDPAYSVQCLGIVGGYRSSKSFLMNTLLGLNSGFELGHEDVGKTRGVWLWAKKDDEKKCYTIMFHWPLNHEHQE